MAMMEMSAGRVLKGPFGTATECLVLTSDEPDHQAHIGTWLLHCPGQSPAWDHYMLSCVHLRPIEGESRAAAINVPGATHEVMVLALNPARTPTPDNPPWPHLTPINVVQQFEVPSDDAAAKMLDLLAHAVVDGILPAEPPLSGAAEPWRTVVIKTAAHARGEEHAP